MDRLKYKTLTEAALLAAMTAVLSQINIPVFSVPLTLQTFAAAFCGYFGGRRSGTAAVAVYILLGAVGMPVFSGFRGGIAGLFGQTGGFLFGFIPLVLLCSAAAGKNMRSFLLGVLGIAACHLMGAAYFSLVMGCGFVYSLTTASLPFVLKDILSVFLAMLFADMLKKRLGFSYNKKEASSPLE